MRTWVRALALCVVFGLMAAPAAAQEPIRIGVNLEMTGAVAAYGQMGWEGLQVIRSLGYDTVLGRPVELILVDNKSDKVEAANATTRLINQGVVAIIGTMTSGNILAAGPIAEEAGIPIIGPSTTNPLVTQGRDYVFRACFTDNYQAEIAAQFAYENLGARRAAVISDIAQDYTVALGQYFTQQFQKLGGTVVTTTYVRTGDQDFTAQLTAVANANPDLLYVPNYYTEDALIARQARELGLTQPILSGDGADAPELLQIGGEAVEGLMHTAFWHEEAAVTELGRRYIEAYRARYNKEPNSFGGLAADAYLMLLHAIEKAGTPDPRLIRDQLEAIDGFEVVTGPVIIENGDAIKPVVIRRVEGGEFRYMTTVFPPELKAYAGN